MRSQLSSLSAIKAFAALLITGSSFANAGGVVAPDEAPVLSSGVVEREDVDVRKSKISIIN